MAVVAHHVLLVASVAALGAAGLRLASVLTPDPLERTVAGAVMAAAAAVVQSLALGLVGWGGSPLSLSLAAGATWLAARRFLPAPERPLAAAARDGWHAAGMPARIALGAVAGAWLAWAVWLLRYPALGIDSVAYHVPEIVGFVQSGRPGAVLTVFPALPVGNYPLTNEVALAWGSGIGRSFVWIGLWAPLMLALLATAAWSGLRTLGVDRTVRAVAILALCATPALTHYQMNGAYSDLPALAFLVACGSLGASAVKRPLLLAPAVVAAGMAVGIKTTTLVLTCAALAAMLWPLRSRLREFARPLGLAVAIAAAVGGYWYARNLVDHGSPFWPIATTPWGDELPLQISSVDTRFIEAPGRTIDKLGPDWLDLFGGGFLIIAAALVAPAVARTRAVALASLAAGASLLLWTVSPLTGAPEGALFEAAQVSTIRYLLPGLAVAVLALCLASTSPRRGARPFALGALAAALVVSVLQTRALGFPSVPSLSTPVLGAAVGAATAAILRLPSLSRPPVIATAGAAAAVLAVGAALAVAAHGYVERHADVSTLFGEDSVRWLVGQDGFRDGDRPVTGAPVALGPLAGDRLQHRLNWIGPGVPCASVRKRARSDYLFVLVSAAPNAPRTRAQRCLAGVRPDQRGRGFLVYGARGH